jgi:hypothetical protein
MLQKKKKKKKRPAPWSSHHPLRSKSQSEFFCQCRQEGFGLPEGVGQAGEAGRQAGRHRQGKGWVDPSCQPKIADRRSQIAVCQRVGPHIDVPLPSASA